MRRHSSRRHRCSRSRRRSRPPSQPHRRRPRRRHHCLSMDFVPIHASAVPRMPQTVTATMAVPARSMTHAPSGLIASIVAHERTRPPSHHSSHRSHHCCLHSDRPLHHHNRHHCRCNRPACLTPRSSSRQRSTSTMRTAPQPRMHTDASRGGMSHESPICRGSLNVLWSVRRLRPSRCRH